MRKFLLAIPIVAFFAYVALAQYEAGPSQDTLDTVVGRGSSTDATITVGGLSTTGSVSAGAMSIDGNLDLDGNNLILSANGNNYITDFFNVRTEFYYANTLRWAISAEVITGDQSGSAYIGNLHDFAYAFNGNTNSGADPIGVGPDWGAFVSGQESMRFSTNSRVALAGQIYQLSVPTISYSGTAITPDADDGNMQKLTMTNNATLNVPTNLQPGASIQLRIAQDANGSRTLAFGSEYKWAGGTTGVLSTAANAVDLLTLSVWATNDVHATLSLDLK